MNQARRGGSLFVTNQRATTIRTWKTGLPSRVKSGGQAWSASFWPYAGTWSRSRVACPHHRRIVWKGRHGEMTRPSLSHPVSCPLWHVGAFRWARTAPGFGWGLSALKVLLGPCLLKPRKHPIPDFFPWSMSIRIDVRCVWSVFFLDFSATLTPSTRPCTWALATCCR